jgi:hypothetical protein
MSTEDIYSIELNHRALIESYRTEAGMSGIIDQQDPTTSFNGSLDGVGSARFCHLRRFCGGLASVFANSTSVEADFSILKWEKDEFRTCLLDLSLEGIFHSKQWDTLASI